MLTTVVYSNGGLEGQHAVFGEPPIINPDPHSSYTLADTQTQTQCLAHGQSNSVFSNNSHDYAIFPLDIVNSGQAQPLFTPVQVFLPPMYSAPLGPVNLPDTTDEGLLHYFMTVASKTWSALDSFGTSAQSLTSCDFSISGHR